MFLENSDRDGLQRLKFPRTVWSSAEQQFAVNGLHGLLSFIVNAGEKERESRTLDKEAPCMRERERERFRMKKERKEMDDERS